MPVTRYILTLGVSFTIGAMISQPAAAHFQEILPNEDVLPEGGVVALDLIFTHPMERGPSMPMERPARVGVSIGGEITDLDDALVEGDQDGVTTWHLEHALDEPGAAVFFVTPQPYWEASEGQFIVHHAKVIVDSYASGIGWDEMVGLPAEIALLTRPTGLWAGNTFTGVVMADGEPVPFAEIEVEYVNDGSITPPNDAFITQTLKADANGTFNYTLPFPGWWGFAALLEGKETMTAPDGSEVPVEEGALIWVKATAPDR